MKKGLMKNKTEEQLLKKAKKLLDEHIKKEKELINLIPDKYSTMTNRGSGIEYVEHSLYKSRLKIEDRRLDLRSNLISEILKLIARYTK